MAVTRVVEIWNGRRGSIDSNGVREYSRVLRVVTNSTYDEAALLIATDAALLLLGLPILPPLMSPYISTSGVNDFGALCKKISCNQLPEDPNTWDIVFDFSSDALSVEQRNLDPGETNSPLTEPSVANPLQRAPVYKWSFNTYSKPIDKDINGNPIWNSAQRKYIPTPEIDDSRPVLTVTRNELFLDPQTVINYQDAVNADVFLGFPIGSCKVRIEAESQYEDGLYYWRVTYQFEFRAPQKLPLGNTEDGWTLALLDHGPDWIDPGGDENPFISKAGTFFDGNLDGNGLPLPADEPPFFNLFTVYKYVPFAPLAIPPVV